MKITLKEVEEIINKEVDWHKNNPSRKVSADYLQGFISGLRQASYLIGSAEKTVRVPGYLGDVGGVGTDPDTV